MCGVNMPARRAKKASKPPRHPPSAAQEQRQRHGCSPISRRLNTRMRYRLIGRARSLSLPAPPHPLARRMVQIGERITPLIDTLCQHLLDAPLIHMDETTLQGQSGETSCLPLPLGKSLNYCPVLVDHYSGTHLGGQITISETSY